MESVDRPATAWRRLLLFVVLSLATRWLSLVVDVIDLDESAHIVGSWELLRGRLLYVDFVDNKPPLLYGYYALAQTLFGRGLFAVHLLTALFTVPLTAYGVSAFFRHRREGLVAAVVFLLYSAAFIGHDMLAANTEILMLLPATWAVVLLRDERDATNDWRVAGAGALIAIACLFRYQAATWGIAFVAGIVIAGRTQRGPGTTVKALLALAAGFVLPLAGTWAWFAAHGAGDDLLYWTVINNLHYAQNPISAREAAERALSYALPFVIVTAPLWWASWRSWTAERWSYRCVLVVGLLAASIPPTLLGLRFYPHYFIQLYSPLALAAAPWAAEALRGPLRSRRLLIGWTAGVVLLFSAANAWLYLTPNRVYRERDPVFHEVAQLLRAEPCYARGTLFVWGYAPIIYYYADMPPASRFTVLAQARLTGYVAGNLEAVRRGDEPDGQVVPAHWDWLMSDLKRSNTTFIVDTAPAGIYRWNHYPISRYPRLQQYVNDEFEVAGDVRRVRLYRRKGCARDR